MSEENKTTNKDDFTKLLEKEEMQIPQVGDIVKGIVIFASKSEVKLDLNGVMVGIVRGRELYKEAEEYANLEEGDEVEATVIDLENENGELELSFSYAGHQKAWANLTSAFEEQENITVKIKDANKGGLVAIYGQVVGFLPVSQLSPENYPRVSGGDKGKILEKLKSFVNKEVEVKIMDLSEKEEKLIVSEKMTWSEQQKDIIGKYKPGTVVEGLVTAITSFGAFISFGENLEGLIHISELAWQRIENPGDIVKVGEKIKAEIINIDGAKIFLSAKKLKDDPWKKVGDKYKLNGKVKGLVLKVNPFGLFVKLDNEIHALAHISSLDLKTGQKIEENFEAGKDYDFYVVSIEPEAHRLGLGMGPIDASSKSESKKIKKSDDKDVKVKSQKSESPTSAKATADKQKSDDEDVKEKKTKKEKDKEEEKEDNSEEKQEDSKKEKDAEKKVENK